MTAIPNVRHLDKSEEEVWPDTRGKISFRTAIGDKSTLTADLCSRVAHLEPGGWLSFHRRAAAGVYQVLTGQGVMTLEGIEHAVHAGSGVYIPSNREHGIRNTGDAPLQFVYLYTTDSIEDVQYVWS